MSGKTVIRGVSYLGERDVSVDTPVSESEKICVLQVEQVCVKKIRLENLSNYCRKYLDGKFPAAQNRTSVTRHEGWATEIEDCSLSRSTLEIHPQNRYGRRENCSNNPENR